VYTSSNPEKVRYLYLFSSNPEKIRYVYLLRLEGLRLPAKYLGCFFSKILDTSPSMHGITLSSTVYNPPAQPSYQKHEADTNTTILPKT